MALANVDSPIGFYPYALNANREAFRIRRDVAASRSLPVMIGDAYALTANTNNAFTAEGTEGTPSDVRGIVEGIELNPLPGSAEGPVSQDYITAADAGAIIGIEDSQQMFRVQATTFANTNLDMRADLVNNTPSLTLRQSRQELDGGTLHASNDLEFLVLDIIPAVGIWNTYGAQAKVMCQLRHVLSN